MFNVFVSVFFYLFSLFTVLLGSYIICRTSQYDGTVYGDVLNKYCTRHFLVLTAHGERALRPHTNSAFSLSIRRAERKTRNRVSSMCHYLLHRAHGASFIKKRVKNTLKTVKSTDISKIPLFQTFPVPRYRNQCGPSSDLAIIVM